MIVVSCSDCSGMIALTALLLAAMVLGRTANTNVDTAEPTVAALYVGRSHAADERHRDKRPAYAWDADATMAGTVLVAINRAAQKATVFRNGEIIGWSVVSTGRSGFETPKGNYPILQKRRDHRSNRYRNAPMPYMHRLTEDGVALHGGFVPGYPASHGCIRFPMPFAEFLFRISGSDTRVLVY